MSVPIPPLSLGSSNLLVPIDTNGDDASSNSELDADACDTVCAAQYNTVSNRSAHTVAYSSANSAGVQENGRVTPLVSICQRGCRLFQIIEAVNAFQESDKVYDACTKSCFDAHNAGEQFNACLHGCDGQLADLKNRNKKKQAPNDDGSLFEWSSLSPLILYANNAYSNLADKMAASIRIRWSYSMQTTSGQVVVVRSEGSTSIDASLEEEDKHEAGREKGERDEVVNAGIRKNLGIDRDSHGHDNLAAETDLSLLKMQEADAAIFSRLFNRRLSDTINVRQFVKLPVMTAMAREEKLTVLSVPQKGRTQPCVRVESGTSRVLAICAVLACIAILVWVWSDNSSSNSTSCSDVSEKHNLERFNEKEPDLAIY